MTSELRREGGRNRGGGLTASVTRRGGLADDEAGENEAAD